MPRTAKYLGPSRVLLPLDIISMGGSQRLPILVINAKINWRICPSMGARRQLRKLLDAGRQIIRACMNCLLVFRLQVSFEGRKRVKRSLYFYEGLGYLPWNKAGVCSASHFPFLLGSGTTFAHTDLCEN